MRNLFKTHKKQSTVDVVIESIRQLLVAKKLVPGQRIPSENEICEGLGVSRGSVREAMKILAAFGVVEIKVGDGTYIPPEPRPALIDPLLFNFLIYNPEIQDVMEFRRLLELDIIELVIEHKSKNAHERELLHDNFQTLERLQRENAGPAALAKNDLEFHRLLGQASCNKLTKRIYDFALDYLENTISDTHHTQDNGAAAYEVHGRILAAIDQNDLEVAKGAVTHSVRVWRKLQPEEAVEV